MQYCRNPMYYRSILCSIVAILCSIAAILCSIVTILCSIVTILCSIEAILCIIFPRYGRFRPRGVRKTGRFRVKNERADFAARCLLFIRFIAIARNAKHLTIVVCCSAALAPRNSMVAFHLFRLKRLFALVALSALFLVCGSFLP